LLCLLDADILVDRDFLQRNHARFADPGHAAHLPHTEMASLDQAASDWAIERRCGDRTAEAPLDGLRGLLLRDVPGACLWARSELYHRIGGFDERYVGWGGEDEDMLYRTAEAGSAVQFDDVFLHLAHRRPPMRNADGKPFNAHLRVGSWDGAAGWGEPTGPVS
jgi:GT2 family glycosyltransferase